MSVVSYKCPCCGAGIAFNSAKGLFKCEYCLSEFTEEQIRDQADKSTPKETFKENDGENADFCERLVAYTCDNCGAEVFADADTVSDFCFYCHNPVICNGRLSGQLKPHKIIPFKFDKGEAEKTFLDFAKKKKFTPTDFFSKEHADKISGVYFPFWLTDVDTDASATARAKKVRTWKVGKNLYTETSHYAIYRSGKFHFEDIATSANASEDKKMLEGVLPYPSGALIDFSMAYLSGYFAKKKNIERESLKEEVEKRVQNYSQKMLMETVSGYTSVTPNGIQMLPEKYSWEYALMPVWVLTYVKGKKIYTYAMNGYTGKIYGELPLSPKKLAWLFGAVSATAALLTVLGGVLGIL